MDVEANRDTLRRKVFYMSLLLFLLWIPFFVVVGVVQCDVAVNALAHWRAWRVSGIRAIGELCSGRASPSRCNPSRVQTFLCDTFGACLRRGPTSRRPYHRGSPWWALRLYALAIIMTSVVLACHLHPETSCPTARWVEANRHRQLSSSSSLWIG